MPEFKPGQRVSVDGIKLGQAKRHGVVKAVASLITVEWDDGHESVFSPGSGNLVVESAAPPAGRAKVSGARGNSTKGPSAGAAKAKPKTAAKSKTAAKAKPKTAAKAQQAKPSTKPVKGASGKRGR